MTYVVTDRCIQCRYSECVEVCPTDAFHAGPNFMVIDPTACTDCGLCETSCPVEAIFPDRELAQADGHYKELNARLAAQWPQVVEGPGPLPDADRWRHERHKLPLLVDALTSDAEPGSEPGH